jgi:signal transduction histidine kinase
VPVASERLHADFRTFFAAVEKNGKGRYRIVYNAARKGPQDYYIDIRFEASDGGPLLMPPVFQDSMRDLVANARKYTAPGGSITAALYEDDRALRFVVSDTGRGIPEAELETVVQFGKRASNVGNVRTMGGGFGLTKAFMVTKRFGGRFWIASELGRGTRIRIVIPLPATAGR